MNTEGEYLQRIRYLISLASTLKYGLKTYSNILLLNTYFCLEEYISISNKNNVNFIIYNYK